MSTTAAEPEVTTDEETPDKTDDLIDAIEEVTPRRPQRIAYSGEDIGEFDKTYIQQPLSFFGNLKFTKIAGRTIKSLIDGGGRVSDLMGGMTVTDISNADVMVQMITQIAIDSPDVMMDIYMIALNVPSYEEPIVRAILEKPHDPKTGEGGLSNEDGFAILETFIAQNGKVLADFFRIEMPRIVKLFQGTTGLGQTSAPSKPSKRSARSTRKAS